MCQSRFRLFSACQDSGFPKKFHVLPNRIYSLHFLLEYLSPSVHGQYSLTASITSKRPSPGQDCAFALWLWIFLFLTDRKLKWSPEPKQNWPRNVKLNPCDCLLSLKIMQGYTRKDGNGIGIRLIQQVFLSPPRKGTVPQNLISFTAAQMCSQRWHSPPSKDVWMGNEVPAGSSMQAEWKKFQESCTTDKPLDCGTSSQLFQCFSPFISILINGNNANTEHSEVIGRAFLSVLFYGTSP